MLQLRLLVNNWLILDKYWSLVVTKSFVAHIQRCSHQNQCWALYGKSDSLCSPLILDTYFPDYKIIATLRKWLEKWPNQDCSQQQPSFTVSTGRDLNNHIIAVNNYCSVLCEASAAGDRHKNMKTYPTTACTFLPCFYQHCNLRHFELGDCTLLV